MVKRFRLILALPLLFLVLFAIFTLSTKVYSMVEENYGVSAPSALPAQNNSSDVDSDELALNSKLLTDLAKTYGVKISTTEKNPSVDASWTSASESDAKNIAKFSKILQAELPKYSTTFINKTGLKNIYLVNDLTVEGQKRSGMPEAIIGDSLYFDINSSYLDSENGEYMRRVFHHEFNHLIEYNLSGSYAFRDKKWLSCNTTNWKYGKGGASMYTDPTYAHAVHPKVGFIDGYATSGIEEDKAEMFAAVMTNDTKLEFIAKSDRNLSCKQEQTKQLIARLN